MAARLQRVARLMLLALDLWLALGASLPCPAQKTWQDKPPRMLSLEILTDPSGLLGLEQMQKLETQGRSQTLGAKPLSLGL
ncbi:exported hypothetical protein [Desulfarculales bacterium]